MTSLADRARGVMLGLACGDALGALVEFRARGTFRTPTRYRNGGTWALRAGQWTDDTAMALALADHLTADVRTSREERADLMGRWVSWWQDGEYSCTGRCFDIGGRTRAALQEWDLRRRTLRPTLQRPYPEGNGAVMRVAPVALRWLRDQEMCESYARMQAMLTHGRIAAAAAVVIAEAVRLLVEGETEFSEILAQALDSQAGQDCGMRDPRILGRPEVLSGGHSVDTVEAALWCVLYARTAEEAIISAVALGDDTDTTAAVTGALAGARWGASALPRRWRDKVAWSSRLTDTADRLLAVATRGE